MFIFAGFLILAPRAFGVLALGISERFVTSDGPVYRILCGYAATIVFLAVTVAVIRRLAFHPIRRH